MPIYKTVAKGSIYGINAVNVFHYETVTPSTVGTEQDDINERWIAQVLPALIAVQSNDFTWKCLTTSIVGPGSAQVYDEILTVGNVGLVAEDSLAPNKCYRATYYSDLMGGNGRGRKHFSGIPESWEDDNAIVQENNGDEPAVLLGDLEVVLRSGFGAGPGGGLFIPVVYSTDLASGSAVIKVIISPQVSSMRSRTTKRC